MHAESSRLTADAHDVRSAEDGSPSRAQAFAQPGDGRPSRASGSAAEGGGRQASGTRGDSVAATGAGGSSGTRMSGTGSAARVGAGGPNPPPGPGPGGGPGGRRPPGGGGGPRPPGGGGGPGGPGGRGGGGMLGLLSCPPQCGLTAKALGRTRTLRLCGHGRHPFLFRCWMFNYRRELIWSRGCIFPLV